MLVNNVYYYLTNQECFILAQDFATEDVGIWKALIIMKTVAGSKRSGHYSFSFLVSKSVRSFR